MHSCARSCLHFCKHVAARSLRGAFAMRTVDAVTYQRPPNLESERKYYWLLGRRPAGAWLRSLSTRTRIFSE
jgi:nuclear transport factor 2 (NTF2) superfamily protein